MQIIWVVDRKTVKKMPASEDEFAMQPYTNVGGNSGISAYESAPDSITVRFKDGSVYLYTTASAGSARISSMKALAECGQGLNSFINRHAKSAYAEKLS